MQPSRDAIPRVLFAIGSLDTGGSENQLTGFLLRTHPKLIDAVLVTWDKPQPHLPNEQRVAPLGLDRYCLGYAWAPPGIRTLLRAWRTVRLLRTLKPDVVYCWLEASSIYFCPLARLLRIPVVVARRNVTGARLERFAFVSWAVRAAERLATLVTGNSEAVIRAAIQRGIRPDRLRLVPNGHDHLPKLPLPESRVVSLGYVAHFRQGKGHLRVVDVLSQVEADAPWRIDFAGAGPLVDVVRQHVEHRGLLDRVCFVGAVQQVRDFWATRDIAVLLSDAEGLPNALVEAAFAGRPIIATEVGGIPEVVGPGGGILIPIDDPAAASSAMRRLIDDPALRLKLGSQAHAQATRRFSWPEACDRHIQAITEAARCRT